MENKNRYTDLIKKYVEGHTNISEEEELLKWKNLSAENREDFETNRKHYEDDLAQIEHQSWDYFEYKCSKIRSIRPQKSLMGLVYKYAAIALLLISVGLAMNSLSGVEALPEQFVAFAPKGEKCNLILPDGSEVKLNSDTKLTYSVNDEKRIAQLKGEAWFHVAKDPKTPFIVQTKDYDVEVLGTSFNVMAYEDFNRTETSLVEGSVKITTKGKVEREILLKPNEKLIYNKNEQIFKKVTLKGPDISWKNNEFHFYNVSFGELAKRLARWYDVEVILVSPELEHLSYSGKFKNKETIWQVLDIIKMTTPISYKAEHRKIIINLK